MQSLQTRLIVPYGLTTLLEGVSRAAVVNHPDDITEFFTLYFQELAAFRREHPDLDLTELVEHFELEFISDNVSKRLEEKTSVFSDTAFPSESKQRDKCTDTEEDHLLPEPDIQSSSKFTQHPSSTSSLAESKSLPASDGASTPVGAELAYVPAEPVELAAHLLGNSPSLCSMRDVATSVQTLHTGSQASEDELTPLEGASEAASEDASAVSADEASVEDVGSQTGCECPPVESAREDDAPSPAAKASVESVRSHKQAWSLSSIAAVLGPSGSQAGGPTNDVNRASEVPSWEEPSPSPAPQDPLWALPSCNKAEITSTTEAVSKLWSEEPDMNVELPPYIEQFPQRIIIPFVDQTAYLLETEQPLKAGKGLNVTTLVPSDLVTHPERMESTAQVEPAERACIFSAMASKEEPQAHHNVWTLYCLTDLRQGKTPSLPCGQATLSLASREAQQPGQLAQGTAPVYAMQDPSKMGSAPPFILVGSNLQSAQCWKPLPSYAIFAQQDAGARRRFTTIPVPVASPAEEELDRASPRCSSAEETAAERHTPRVCSVAVPLPELMAAHRDSRAQREVEKRGCACKKSSGMDFLLQ